MVDANTEREESKEEIFLPDLVLIQTISYLEVTDRRSCRLVCRRWYSCCEDKTITKSEIFEFHAARHRTSQINEFLINHERARTNVRFILIDLTELNFEAFGMKIEELEIIFCALHVETLINIFKITPDMTRLQVRLITHQCSSAFSPASPRILNFEMWNTVVNRLYDEEFQHDNLKELKCNLRDIKLMDRIGHRLILSHIFFIFPHMRSISLWSEMSVIDMPELRDTLPTSNVTHFGGIFRMDFDIQDQLETFGSSFSRLKILNLRICLSAEKRSSLSSCEGFFSHLTELEELILECKVLASPKSLHISPNAMIKAVLAQILRSSLKLSKLQLFFQPLPRINIRVDCRSRNEIQECLLLQ